MGEATWRQLVVDVHDQIPGLATAGMTDAHQLVVAYAVGAVGYVVGLALSAAFDLPSGALIVWNLAGCALLVQLVPAVRYSHPPKPAAAHLDG